MELAENPEIDNVASWLDDIFSPEAAEGVVFFAAEDDSTDSFAHVPLDSGNTDSGYNNYWLSSRVSASVCRPCDFPPFPPERDVEFKIQLEAGAQVSASGMHKLSPELSEAVPPLSAPHGLPLS